MKLYEGMFLFSPHLKIEDFNQLTTEVEEEIKKLKGEIVESHALGKKKLAYLINKLPEGYFHLVFFKLAPAQLDVLNNKLRLNEKVLRSLILNTSDDLMKNSAGYLQSVGAY